MGPVALFDVPLTTSGQLLLTGKPDALVLTGELEINRLRYKRGTVGMALAGPDTGGSQFFIALSEQPHLDGGYTVFGQVVAGDEILDRIVPGDRIEAIVEVREVR